MNGQAGNRKNGFAYAEQISKAFVKLNGKDINDSILKSKMDKKFEKTLHQRRYRVVN